MIRQAKPDALTLLIHCGWGDLPQSQARKTVPADVLADAEAGRMPRTNPKRSKADRWKFVELEERREARL